MKSPAPKKVPIALRLGPDLLGRLDAEAQRRGVSRTGLLELAVERLLEPEVPAPQPVAVEGPGAGEPESLQEPEATVHLELELRPPELEALREFRRRRRLSIGRPSALLRALVAWAIEEHAPRLPGREAWWE